MNLPFLKRFNKKILPLYYLVLVLRDEKAQAIIVEELGGKVKTVGYKEEHFSTSIDEISQEELLEKLDKAISQAESSLPENIKTQKTIFGVKDSWTDNDQIKKEYLSKLKKASEELELIPIGFLVISQAIAHMLQQEEGAPVSAILTEINKKSVTVTLLRAGKSIETKSSEIHDSVPFTVDTLLKHFDIPEILPSRIIIFNGKEDLSQEFISYTWSKSLPFLHLPQITNLPEGFDARSVLFGAATQMGFEVLGKDTPVAIDTQDKESMQNFSASEEFTPPADELEATNQEPLEEPKLYKKLEAEDFGFVKDVDVAKMPVRQEEKEEVQEIEEKQEVISQFIAEDMSTNTEPSKKFNKILKNILITTLGFVLIIVRKIRSGRLSIAGSTVLILIVLLFVSYFLFLKATITVSVTPEISEQNKSILFSTTKTTDPNKNTINGEFISVSEEGSVSTAATGKKDVGTPAKGAVTIFNLSNNTKTLPAGTEISSLNDLKFVLDNSVTLASASSSVDSNFNKTTKPSTVKVNVTADQLGKESNLPSGTKFNVASLSTSDLVAKNDNPFSGGTKKEVTVASKNDSDKLEKDLIKQLEDKAKEDLQKQLTQNKILLSAFVSETLSKKSLNPKIGDETSKLSLTGTVKYQEFSYDKNDLITFSKSLLSKDIPSNQEIDYNNIKASVLDIKNKNDEEIQANLSVKTLLLPKIDQSKLTKDLKGKSFNFTKDALNKLPQVENIDIKLSPNLPFLPKKLPTREKNIKISIKING